MRFFVQYLVTLLVAAAVGYFFPWWSMVPAAGVVGLCCWYRNSFFAFLAAFLAVGTLWAGYAYFLAGADVGLLPRFSALLSLEAEMLPLVVAVLGGLLGGLGAWTGAALRKALFPAAPGSAATPVVGGA